MSLADIIARDATAPKFNAFTPMATIEEDRRYLLGLLKEAKTSLTTALHGSNLDRRHMVAILEKLEDLP